MVVVEVAREEEDNTNVVPFYAAIEAFNAHNSTCIVLLRHSAKIEAESIKNRLALPWSVPK